MTWWWWRGSHGWRRGRTGLRRRLLLRRCGQQRTGRVGHVERRHPRRYLSRNSAVFTRHFHLHGRTHGHALWNVYQEQLLFGARIIRVGQIRWWSTTTIAAGIVPVGRSPSCFRLLTRLGNFNLGIDWLSQYLLIVGCLWSRGRWRRNNCQASRGRRWVAKTSCIHCRGHCLGRAVLALLLGRIRSRQCRRASWTGGNPILERIGKVGVVGRRSHVRIERIGKDRILTRLWRGLSRWLQRLCVQCVRLNWSRQTKRNCGLDETAPVWCQNCDCLPRSNAFWNRNCEAQKLKPTFVSPNDFGSPKNTYTYGLEKRTRHQIVVSTGSSIHWHGRNQSVTIRVGELTSLTGVSTGFAGGLLGGVDVPFRGQRLHRTTTPHHIL
jgi:hypothetical protein